MCFIVCSDASAHTVKNHRSVEHPAVTKVGYRTGHKVYGKFFRKTADAVSHFRSVFTGLFGKIFFREEPVHPDFSSWPHHLIFCDRKVFFRQTELCIHLQTGNSHLVTPFINFFEQLSAYIHIISRLAQIIFRIIAKQPPHKKMEIHIYCVKTVHSASIVEMPSVTSSSTSSSIRTVSREVSIVMLFWAAH